MGYAISRNNAAEPLVFLLVLSADHITGATGKTPTVTISKNGGAFTTPLGAVTEIGNGLYKVAADAQDANTLGPLFLHATAPGCDPVDEQYDVVDYNPTSAQPISPPTSATFGTVTAYKLIKRALRMLGVIDPGQELEASAARDALETLNSMMSLWATKRLLMYQQTRNVYPLVGGQESYTIGPGGDFDQPRPIYILRAGIVSNVGLESEHERPMDPMLTPQQWRSIGNKRLQSALPRKLYYERSFPLGTLYPWPVLSSGTLSLAIYLPVTVLGFADLHVEYAFPDGYDEALATNLGVRLSSEWGKPLPDEVRQLARESKGAIQIANITEETMTTDRALNSGQRGRAFDWRQSGA